MKNIDLFISTLEKELERRYKNENWDTAPPNEMFRAILDSVAEAREAWEESNREGE